MENEIIDGGIDAERADMTAVDAFASEGNVYQLFVKFAESGDKVVLQAASRDAESISEMLEKIRVEQPKEVRWAIVTGTQNPSLSLAVYDANGHLETDAGLPAIVQVESPASYSGIPDPDNRLLAFPSQIRDSHVINGAPAVPPWMTVQVREERSGDRSQSDDAAGPGRGDTGRAGIQAAGIENLDTFAAELDSRLAAAAINEEGWRNRDDIEPLLEDMGRLARVDFVRAAKLWASHRPNDFDAPRAVDGDDVPASDMARAENNASAKDADSAREADVVEALRRRYLKVENQYYFREQEESVAFSDRGRKLATKHVDPDVIHSMLDLAEARGWNSVKLKGGEDFRREAWLQASLRGMDVQGYKPRDVDLSRLDDMRSAQEVNTIEQAPERDRPDPKSRAGFVKDRLLVDAEHAEPIHEQYSALSNQEKTVIEVLKDSLRARGDSEAVVTAAAEVAADRFNQNRMYVGLVVDHGEDHYQHDAKQPKNYFVEIRQGDELHKVWGVDLKRVIAETGIQKGDEIALAYQGRQPVTVTVPVRGDHGAITDWKKIDTNRNTWDAIQLSKLVDIADGGRVDKAREAFLARWDAGPSGQPVVKTYDPKAPAKESAIRELRAKDREKAIPKEIAHER